MRRAPAAGERESWGSARPHEAADRRHTYAGYAGGAGSYSGGGGGGYDERERGQWAAPRRGRSRSRSPRRERELHARGFEGGGGGNQREQHHGGAYAYSEQPANREDGRHAAPRRMQTDGRGRGGGSRMVFDAPPNSTLIFKNLSPGVDETMILRALESFSPIKVSVIRDRETGLPRGFAFVEFPSVEHATSVVKGFEFIPLVFDERAVVMGYADRTNRRPQPGEADRQRHFGSGYPPQQDDHHGSSQSTGPPRLFDWFCDQCNATNFSRRTECFKCFALKPQNAREVPPDSRSRGFTNVDGNYSGGSGSGSYSEHGRVYDNTRGSSNFYDNDRQPQPFPRADEATPPSNVLVVRHIPLEVDEGELQVVFASLDGLRDIRLVRDRATNESRGFAFVEFNDVDAAGIALSSCQNLSIGGNYVRVSYAYDSFHPRPDNRDRGFQDRGEHSSVRSAETNSLTATALEQAQWALANGYRRGGEAATEDVVDQQNNIADDVNSLLASAAEAAKPHIEEPKKQWPPPFETAGGSYVYASDVGLYWDSDTMFYYSTATKLYYSTFLGKYYRCEVSSGGGDFKEVSPPIPVDDTAFESQASSRESNVLQKPGAGSSKSISVSLKLPTKKKAPISFGMKVSPTTAAKKPKTDATTTGSSTTPFAVAAAAAAATPVVGAMPSAGMMRKSAQDIAKWSQVQKKTKSEEQEGASGSLVAPAKPNSDAAVKSSASSLAASAPTQAASVVDSIVNTTTVEAPICLLCRRKFASMEILRKHETMSKLHLDNLAKAREAKQAVAAEYRERERAAAAAQEKREREAANQEIEAKRQRLEAAAKPAPDASAALEQGIGGKMLKMMGWKSGEGLGKRGTGITAPISAAGSTSGGGASGASATAGLGSKPAVAVEVLETATFKERVQSVARARYDAMQ